jgi:hypothetical protein
MADNTVGINFVVNGAGQAAAEAGKVAQSLGGVNDAATKGAGGVGGLGAGFGKLAVGAGVALGALRGVRSVLDEVAENDQAAITLAKFGVSAEEAGKHAEILAGLKMFTQGDEVRAAEIYGKTINGLARELRPLGIELDENSTRSQRLAALQTLAARGADTQSAANDTLTGSLKNLKVGIMDSIGDWVSWAAGATGVTRVAGALAAKFTKTMDIPEAVAAQNKLQRALNATRLEADALAATMGRLRDATDGARIAALAFDDSNKRAGRDKAEGEAGTNAALAGVNAEIAAQEKAGRMTPEAAARARTVAGEQSAMTKAQATTAGAADRAKAAAGVHEEVGLSLRNARAAAEGITDPEERKKADAEVEKLRVQQEQARQQKLDAESAAKVAAAEEARLADEQRAAASQHDMEEAAAIKKREDEAWASRAGAAVDRGGGMSTMLAPSKGDPDSAIDRFNTREGSALDAHNAESARVRQRGGVANAREGGNGLLDKAAGASERASNSIDRAASKIESFMDRIDKRCKALEQKADNQGETISK